MHVLAPLIVILTAAGPEEVGAPAEAPSETAQVPRKVRGPLVPAGAARDDQLARIKRSLEALKAPPPAPTPLTAPPLVPADGPEQEEIAAPADASPPEVPADIPDVLAPTPPRPEVKTDESERRGGPPPRVGVVGLAGGEVAFNTVSAGMSFRPRVGLGMRVALTAPSNDETVSAVPSLALLGGYAGLLDHRVFAEFRTELVVNRGGESIFMPGFTVYALGGFDALLAGGIDPYVGVGMGWDHNIFKGAGAGAASPRAKTGGAHLGGWGGGSWGNLGGGGGGNGLGVLAVLAGAAVAAAVAVGLVIGFVCAGRVEFRYHPASPRQAAPIASVLIGYGI